MRNKLTKVALAVGFGLAMVFTFSCSSGDDDNGENNHDGGNDSSFTSTSGTFVDNRDNKSYKWVKIGEQYWLAENLKYDVPGRSKCYGEGGQAYDPKTGSADVILSPSEIQANCAKYGMLYDWATAMDISSDYNNTSYNPSANTKYRGVCPQGWHIPSDAEWTVLIDFVGTTYNLRATSGSGWGSSSDNDTDDYGFSALPGRYGYPNGNFSTDGGGDAGWWSATEYNASDAWARVMDDDDDGVLFRGNGGKNYLFSVRCVKNN